MGLAKLIDLATGVNAQIIGTSNYWKFDFFTNVMFVIVSIPLNFYLIQHYDLTGLAYSNLIAYTLYNSVRFGFLYIKFKLQPYSWKHAIYSALSIGLMLLVHQIPAPENFILNIAIQSVVYGAGFYLLTAWINPAPEIMDYFKGFVSKQAARLFKKG
jgi:O-antigen/teichoic acid export membrane protein